MKKKNFLKIIPLKFGRAGMWLDYSLIFSRLISKKRDCRKKWDGKGIDIKMICRGPARGMMRVQNDPSTGEKWVVLDDLVLADNLMIEFDEEVPHHSQWTEL